MGILGMFLAVVLFFLGLFSALVAFEMYNTATSGVHETTMMVTWLISAVCFGFSTVCALICLTKLFAPTIVIPLSPFFLYCLNFFQSKL